MSHVYVGPPKTAYIGPPRGIKTKVPDRADTYKLEVFAKCLVESKIAPGAPQSCQTVPWIVWGYVMRDLKALPGPGSGGFPRFYLRVPAALLAQNGLTIVLSAPQQR